MRHVSRLKSFIWYSTVGLLVVLAVLVTLMRLSSSYVSDYRAQLEQLAGEYLGQPVTIGAMDARLVGFKPSVLLQEVSLQEKQSNERLADFAQISIALNPVASLRNLAPIIELTVSGADIVVIQQPDGSFVLQGVTLSPQASNEESGGALGAWFLSQSRLSLEESRVIWQNRKTGREHLFDKVNIELRNMPSHHRLNAAVALPGEYGEELRLALDIRGNLLNRREWEGEMYLKASQLQPAPWLQEVELDGVRVHQGRVDLEAWSRWQDGQLAQVEGELDLRGLEMTGVGGKLGYERVAAEFRLQQERSGWQLQLQNALLQSAGREAQPFSLQLQQQEGRRSLRARDLDLAAVTALATQLPVLPEAQREQLRLLNPQGRVELLHLELQQGEVTAAVASVKQAGMQASGKLPGMHGLSAELRFDGNQGVMDVDSHGLVATLPNLFGKPLALGQVLGRIQARRLDEGWHILSQDLVVENEDLELELDMSLQWQPGEVPLMALSGRFGNGRARAVPDYLPVKIMSPATVGWLNRAFASGTVASGSVLIHGRLEKSLLREEQGRFEVRFDTRGVALDYQQGWPRLEGIDAEARFSGRGMAITARSARVYRSAVTGTRVRIRDFRLPVLEVDGEVAAAAEDALRFVRESPLAGASREALEAMRAEGNTPLKLKMSIPLSARARASSPLAVEGQVEFRENRLQVLSGVVLEQVRGVLSFSEASFSASNIGAMMYGHPASVSVFTDSATPPARAATVVAVQGHASAAALRDAVQLPLLERLDGETDWQARLTLEAGERGGVELDVYSSLQGMALDLPEPLYKETTQNIPLAITLGLAGRRSGFVRLRYGHALKVISQQEGLLGKLQRMALQFDDEREPQLPEQEAIHVSGNVKRLDWGQWQQLLQSTSDADEPDPQLPLIVRLQRLHVTAEAGSANSEGGGGLQRLPQLDLHIKDFSYKGMPFGEVSLRVEPQERRAEIQDVSVVANNFVLQGKGRWDYGGKSRFQLELHSESLGNMLSDLGYASVISDGKTRSSIDAKWSGSPLQFSLAELEAKGRVEIEEGVIHEVKAGAGKLLGLLSLQALPRRLFLDFSDLSGEGLRFNSIKGDLTLRNGNAYTENMLLKALPADVLVTGRTGLVARDYDQLVIVVPQVSDTVSVAGALAWGPQVAAALILLQKIFKSDIDAATMIRYSVTGSWEKPQIRQLDRVAPAEGEQR